MLFGYFRTKRSHTPACKPRTSAVCFSAEDSDCDADGHASPLQRRHKVGRHLRKFINLGQAGRKPAQNEKYPRQTLLKDSCSDKLAPTRDGGRWQNMLARSELSSRSGDTGHGRDSSDRMRQHPPQAEVIALNLCVSSHRMTRLCATSGGMRLVDVEAMHNHSVRRS